MPSDIRSFFGGKAGDDTVSDSKRSQTQKDAGQPASKAKGKGKRKIMSDSEDEAKETIKTSPRKPPAKRNHASPKPEETTASQYFGTKKASRSASERPKAAANAHPAISKEINHKKSETRARPSETPKKPATTATSPPSNRSVRLSARAKKQQSYAEKEPSDDDDDGLMNPKADDSGEDIHQAEFGNGRGRAADHYESDDDSEEDDRPKKGNKRATNGRKRKSATASDDDDEPDRQAKKKKGAAPSPSKPAPKKARQTPQKKSKPAEDAKMQDIFNSIPTIRAPSPPQRNEQKKFDFKAHAARSQPAPLSGSKEIPVGAEDCLSGLTFVFTGLLDSLGREEGQSLVKRYGGKVTGAPSKTTSYVVLGNDAGPKKLETIRENGLTTIDEEGLFALIRKLPAHGGTGVGAAKASEKRQAEEKKTAKAAEDMAKEMAREEEKRNKRVANGASDAKARSAGGGQVEDRLWTTKYAPTQLAQVCGNQAAVKKLQTWLRDWPKNAKANFKKPGPDGSGTYRAIMLHGAPGIGKTTAAHLVAKVEGYDMVESNASDTRSKKLVETGLKGVLDTTSLFGYLPGGDGDKVESSKKKLVLIMDEVDGMSAGDRGGVGAMASVCRKTRIPIILICNERKLPKMKPFDHVTFDLLFRKPTVDQVRSRIMTILFREKMKDVIPPNVINSLIEGAGADIRRIINMISTVKLDQSTMDFEESKRMANAWEKNIVLRPFEITKRILGHELFASHSTASLNDKAALYFNEHDFSFLMLQENYLSTNPAELRDATGKARDKCVLDLVDQAAESISDGDLVDSMIHGTQQHWSLMPVHAIFSFVRPASFVYGGYAGQPSFTSWLGNNSKTGKFTRCVKEIQGHMRLRASGDRHEIRQQYLPLLWTRLVKALELHGDKPHGIEDIIELMDSYFITKDDWDAIYELGLGPQAMEKVKLSTQNKSNFTRKYNQASHPLPFMKAGGAPPAASKGKDKPDLEEALEESEGEEAVVDVAAEDEESELDLKKDKYVKAPKKKAGPKKAAAGKGKTQGKKDADASEDEEPNPASKKGKAAGSTRGKGKK